MKKVLLSLTVIFFFVSTVKSQKWEPVSFTVGEDCMATVTLKNELGQIMTKNIRAILSGKYVENRQGLLLSPPLRPERWEVDKNTEQPVIVNSKCNPGFSIESGCCYGQVCIVEGYYIQGGKAINWSIRNQTVSFATFSDSWLDYYEPYTYKVPNFCMEVSVNKRGSSYFN